MRLLRSTALLITVLVALLLGAAAAQQRPPGAPGELRAAIDKANVEGDLPGAIKQLQAIVDRYGRTDRVTAATALMQMAECYQKLGDAQARTAYERVLRDFADVPAVAASARSRLAALKAGGRSTSPPTLGLRRIYDGPGLDWCNGLSSDARYLSHPEWLSGNIAITDLATGTMRPVTTTGSINKSPGEYGECSIFSRDNRQLAYYWFSEQSELRVSAVDGGPTRTLFRTPDFLRPLDWSPDGRSILVLVYSPKGPEQLAVVSTADGAIRRFETAPDHSLKASFSPDGRYIAYSGAKAPDPAKSDVFIMAINGSRQTEIVGHPADDGLLGWSEDGGRVSFWSDRTGSGDVWSIGVANGSPQGTPLLTKSNIGDALPVRLVKNTLYYTMISELSDIQVATVDSAAGKLLSPFAPAKRYFSMSNFAPEWSPDGRFLAYRSTPASSNTWVNPAAVISVLNIETREERTLRPRIAKLDPVDGPHWSPDGKSLLVIGMQNTPDAGVYTVDATTGTTVPVVKTPPGQWVLFAAWARDGGSIFYTISQPTRIVRRDLASGAEKEIVRITTSPAGVPRLSVSPDGRTLAYIAREPGNRMIRTINLVSTDGGPSRDIYRTGENEGMGGLAWTPDGRHIVFRKMVHPPDSSNRLPPSEFWRVTADGSRAERMEMKVQSGRGPFSLSPDGRRLAIAVGESKIELWALENLTAPAKRGS